MVDTDQAAHLVLQVAVIVLAAKIFGSFTASVLKQPSVLGELVAGMIIGPHLLGAVEILGMGALFPMPEVGAHPLRPELHTLGLLASTVLLFHAGLETDVQKFLKYSVAGLVIGLGGAVLSFALGNAVTVWTGFAESYTAPDALFLGTVATATSVGLTARILSERRKMDSAEGATILSGAVIDDIIGLVLLAMVLAIVGQRGDGGESVLWVRLAWIAAKAVIFWIVAMGLGILFARQIGSFLGVFGSNTSICTVTLGLVFLLAALAERSGLALIIGAYIVGVSLSRIDRAHAIQDRLAPVYDLLVPMFFCMIGMSVDFRHIGGTLFLGLVFAAACIFGKVVGCGAAALPLGFNIRGAARIGVGMMPRQEVALIVAGIAFATKSFGPRAFGSVVVMTFVTTLIAPTLLAWLFGDKRSGLRHEEEEPPKASETFSLAMPSPEVAQLVAERLVEAFRAEGFFVHRRAELSMYEMRKGAGTVFLTMQDSRLIFHTTPDSLFYARMVALEELVSLRKLFNEAASFDQLDQMRNVFLGKT